MIKDLLLVFVCLINVYLGLTIYKVYIYIMHKGALLTIYNAQRCIRC